MHEAIKKIELQTSKRFLRNLGIPQISKLRQAFSTSFARPTICNEILPESIRYNNRHAITIHMIICWMTIQHLSFWQQSLRMNEGMR
eukprot:c33378_g1_i1 orf=52-312(+)